MTISLRKCVTLTDFQVVPQLKEILSGFDNLLFPAVPKSMIGSVSELLGEMGQRVFETKCYAFVLKDESKLVKLKYSDI